LTTTKAHSQVQHSKGRRQPPFFFPQSGLTDRSQTNKSKRLGAGRLRPMVEALREHGLTLLILLNTLVVGLVVGGVLCATLICR
jgi:hypothetical protein